MKIGLNEALALSALEAGDSLSVADVAKRLSTIDLGRCIDDGSIYLALHRMSQRGLVRSTKGVVTSADGKQREIRFYVITAQGQGAVSQFARETRAMAKLAGLNTA